MPDTDFPRYARTWLRPLTRAGLWLSTLLLIGIALLVSLQVLLRNVFDTGLPWADELSRWFGITIVYLTVPSLLGRGGLISVTFLPDMLRGSARLMVQVAAEIAVAVFAGLVLYAFAKFLGRAAWFRTPALGLPNLIFYLPPLTGFALLAVTATARIIGLLSPGRPT